MRVEIRKTEKNEIEKYQDQEICEHANIMYMQYNRDFLSVKMPRENVLGAVGE